MRNFFIEINKIMSNLVHKIYWYINTDMDCMFKKITKNFTVTNIYLCTRRDCMNFGPVISFFPLILIPNQQ